MVNSRDDIAQQARQGSVAAIIQVLNEKLAQMGVRTRAVRSEGILQLLCEASTEQQLEQSQLVSRIQEILEAIAPRNIRQVNINSRIAREQQLLWLEEINRDPESQLLWSEKITLKKPNILQRLKPKSSQRPTVLGATASNSKVKLSSLRRNRGGHWRGIVGGVSVSLLIFWLGWLFSDRLQPILQEIVRPTPEKLPSPDAVASPNSDSFSEAVRLAQEAWQKGEQATTAAEWLELAAKWERAADLMNAVGANHPRYDTAQDRVVLYRFYSQQSQENAEKLRQE
ncbi:MAG: hypothetical protein ACOC0N_04495 [Chroococcales cyanobacterium]